MNKLCAICRIPLDDYDAATDPLCDKCATERLNAQRLHDAIEAMQQAPAAGAYVHLTPAPGGAGPA